jgi:hypothetical protein
MSIVVESKIQMDRIHRSRAAVRRRLAGVRRSLRAHLLWEGLAWTVAACVAFAAASLAIDRLVRPELASRIVILVAAAAAIGVVVWRMLIQPLRLRLDDLDLAELLDRRRPGVGQRLTNVLQLPELLERGKIDGSPAMIEAAVLEDAAALEQIDLRASFNFSRRRKLVALLLGIVALVALFCSQYPSVAALWTKRWFAASHVRWPQHTYLKVLGLNDEGRLLVALGEAAIVEVDAQPDFVATDGGWKIAGRSDLALIPEAEMPRSELPDSVAIELLSASGGRKQGNFTHYEGGRFRYELPPVNEATVFSLTGGDDWLGPIEIEPIDRPTVKDLIITAQVPGKSDPEVHHAAQQDSPLQFLSTTKLEIEMISDQPLASARILGSGDELPELKMVDSMRGQAEMTIKNTQTLEFQLIGEHGSLASKPFFLTIGLLVDRPPRVTIRVTGVGRRVTPTARIPLAIRGVDDFGIAQIGADLELTRVVDSKPQASVHQPFVENLTEGGQSLPPDVQREPVIKLAELEATPGNLLRIRGRATDACALGAQEGTSRWVPLEVVTPEELFYEILTRQRVERGRFAKALEMAKGQLEAIPKVAGPDDGGSISRVHQVVTRQVWQVATQLDATLQEMTYNDLGSPQARDLLESAVIEPLKKLHDDGFASITEKMQTMLSHREIREADRQALLDAQQAAVTEMQRILAQMSQWESFVDVINQLRQIKKTQNDVLQSTEKTEKERIKGIFD